MTSMDGDEGLFLFGRVAGCMEIVIAPPWSSPIRGLLRCPWTLIGCFILVRHHQCMYV